MKYDGTNCAVSASNYGIAKIMLETEWEMRYNTLAMHVNKILRDEVKDETNERIERKEKTSNRT